MDTTQVAQSGFSLLKLIGSKQGTILFVTLLGLMGLLPIGVGTLTNVDLNGGNQVIVSSGDTAAPATSPEVEQMAAMIQLASGNSKTVLDPDTAAVVDNTTAQVLAIQKILAQQRTEQTASGGAVGMNLNSILTIVGALNSILISWGTLYLNRRHNSLVDQVGGNSASATG